ncbi:MAG: enoyl-CoA hydratase [Burkholderiaceae bacterium]|jgi:enoyl-CoA hydratase/carnithine racemase
MSNLIQEVISPGLLRITLNRPEAFNSLSEDLLGDLKKTLSSISTKTDTRVVILAANGKAFCAGHDLKEMMQEPSETYYQSLFTKCTEMMLTLQRMPQPVIAQVQGIATAAGCQLVAMCDLAVASENAKFAVSGINLGLFCSTPGVALSRNLLRKQALEMLLTGEFLTASEAKEKGLVNRVVPAEQLEAETIALAKIILSKPAEAVRLGKQLFYRQIEQPIQDAYNDAGSVMACNMMDKDALEGVQAFIDKRKPAWAGS